MADTARRRASTPPIFVVLSAAVVVLGTFTGTPSAMADNQRLNNGVVTNVDTIKRQAGCGTELTKSPQLQLAAQWHAVDVLNNHALNGDIGTDGSTVQDRARNAGYSGTVSETVATIASLAINNMDVMGNWYYRPDYYAIMSDCNNLDIGVWSENKFDRSVLVAVYGQPA